MLIQHQKYGDIELPDDASQQDVNRAIRNQMVRQNISNVMGHAGNVMGMVGNMMPAPAAQVPATLPIVPGRDVAMLSGQNAQSLFDRVQRSNEVQQQNRFQAESMRQRERETVMRQIEAEKDRAQQLKLEAARQTNQDKAMKLQLKQQKDLAEAREAGATERASMQQKGREQDRSMRLMEALMRPQGTSMGRAAPQPRIFGGADTGYMALGPDGTISQLTQPRQRAEKPVTQQYQESVMDLMGKGMTLEEARKSVSDLLNFQGAYPVEDPSGKNPYLLVPFDEEEEAKPAKRGWFR